MPFLPVSYEYQEFWSFQVVCWHSMTDVSATWAQCLCNTLIENTRKAGWWGSICPCAEHVWVSISEQYSSDASNGCHPTCFFLPKCVAIYRLVTCFIGAWCCISFEARSLIHWWHTHCLTISLTKNHYILLYVGDTLVQFKRFFLSL